MTGPDATRVSVLLATLDGAEFLAAQLKSLENQTHANWRLLVGDDGSTDATLAMLETFVARLGRGRVVVQDGPRRGATANFLRLIESTGPDDGCLAFCDQDDIWFADKLTRAVAQLAGLDRPALYACRVVIAGPGARGERVSCLPSRTLGLRSALAENPMTGNSMVLNPAAAALLRATIAGAPDRARCEAGFHDWLAYQVVAAAGGLILFDPLPGLRYRQHAGNLVGSGQARGRGLSRLARVFSGAYGRAVRLQALALLECPVLSPPDRALTRELLSLPDLPIWRRPAVIRRLGLYRQRRGEDLVLKLLMFLGRV